MAQRIQIQLVDDINGQEADETVRFGIDGTMYEIDLSAENAARLREKFGLYLEKGRKARGRSRPSSDHTGPTGKTTATSGFGRRKMVTRPAPAAGSAKPFLRRSGPLTHRTGILMQCTEFRAGGVCDAAGGVFQFAEAHSHLLKLRSQVQDVGDDGWSQPDGCSWRWVS